MIAYKVKINGKAVCTAGVGDYGFLAADLLWNKRNPEFRSKGGRKKEWDEELLYLRISGLVVHDERIRERVVWADKPLSAGDEIVIRILEQQACDEPLERDRFDKTERKQRRSARKPKSTRKKRRRGR